MYICNDCPRNCNSLRDKLTGKGFCQNGEDIPVAKVMRHMWEEPCLNSGNGTENIFLFGCNLKCVFCQNYKISGSDNDYDKNKLTYYNADSFSKLLLDINKTDADTIGIVTGDHFVRTISNAITEDVKANISKPIVFNFNGYAKVDILELLRNKIDIFMPDFKFSTTESGLKFAGAKDYCDIAKKAIKKCFEITGPCVWDENNMLKKGTIIRHLILPGKVKETCEIIDFVNENFNKGDIIFSLMSQYTPILSNKKVREDNLLSRTISKAERKKSIAYLENAENISLCYIQEEGTAKESFIPDF